MVDVSLLHLFRYFLFVGATVFGGPIAIIENFRTDLVEKKKWIKEKEFEKFFGYSQIAPGPISFQVALHIGYSKKGWFGAMVSGTGLMLPSFLAVLLFSVFYSQYKNVYFVRYILYGLGPVIIAIILHSGFKLTSSVLKKEIFPYIILVSSFLLVVFQVVNIIILIFAGAFIYLLYDIIINKKKIFTGLFLFLPFFLLAGEKFCVIKEQLNSRMLDLSILFLKVGSLTYGSGFAIIGVLKQEVVDNLGWLSNVEFLDGVAFGQITSGPVIITSTFIGYMISGIMGSVLSTICILLPTYIYVLIIQKFIHNLTENFYLNSFIRGANAAAIGAILATAFLLSKDAIYDTMTVLLFVAGLILMFVSKIKPIFYILAAGILGFVIKSFVL